MKCEAPALASVSSREPAPIQKPIATERTPGTRSEMTRSPESSSERTYFCTTPPLLRVGLQELIDEIVDLLQGELGGRVRVEHGRVVGMVWVAAERRLDGELLDVDARAHQGRQLRRQRADGPRRDPGGAGDARHLDTAVGEVVDPPLVHHVPVERERRAGLERVDDVGAVLVAALGTDLF